MTVSLSHRLDANCNASIENVLNALYEMNLRIYTATVPSINELEALQANFLTVFRLSPSRYMA